MENPSFAFFGTPKASTIVLKVLKEKGFTPALIVTAPDRARGRKMIVTPPPVGMWAKENKVEMIQPEKITDEVIKDIKEKAPKGGWDFFVVFSYGYILPKELLDIPKHGVLNVHPSLLPKLRGASPIRGAILNYEKETGVSIILLDEKMDHGPILAQKKIELDKWPMGAIELEEKLSLFGGELLFKTIEDLFSGNVTPKEQNHNKATFSKKIKKEDGLLDLSASARENFLKIKAYEGWPGTYFFTDKGVRVKVTDAVLENGELKITRVVPEGRREMSYEEFLKTKTNACET
ncbi:MAG: methionyl-tRNA formyltransferase [Parcubacteria group bacterium]|nr:methionyl-tRNA formyltransferase [Parcubacteria group bacterium]